MSSLKRGRAIKQPWYAVLRHKRGNPDTCYTVTYPCCCTLSTLPVDGTLALEAARGLQPYLVCLHCRHFGETTFANVAGIRIVDLPADPSHVRSCLLMFYNMTSDDRGCGFEPCRVQIKRQSRLAGDLIP